MLVRLLVVVLLLGLCMYSVSYIRRQPPEAQKRLWWKALLIGGGVTLGLLAITGKLHWIGILVAALVPLFKTLLSLATRAMPIILPWLQHKSRTQQGNARSTSTQYLQFIVDKNGDMGGMIVKGALTGKQLKDLSEPQLLDFLNECKACRDSYDVLVAYINRYHPNLLGTKSKPSSSNLSHREALQILGLTKGYSKEDVKKAHRNLIQKLHPDRGGNDYLASQINAAKEKLLKDI